MSATVEVDVRPRSYVYKKRSDSNTDTDEQQVKRKPPPLDMEKARTRDDSDGNIQSAPKTPNTADLKTEKKIGHRRVDNTTGQVTYKKRATTDLMKAIQLGIGQTIGSLSSKPNRDVLMQDFSVVETVIFPEDGSNLTPAHRVGDFKFKTYAPVAFRHFRERFDIAMDDFLISLSTQHLIELSNPGASGSVFFITEDDEFIIKTVQHKEAEFLQKLLPGYYMNLNQNPRTLLPKFYGLYCYQSAGKNIRLVIMNNLLPSSIRMSEKYDLKGSTYKRKASKRECEKASPTYKDLDFLERHKEGIFLESETYDALMKTIKRDCRVLESFKIMDYSLLLCLYNVDEAKKNKDKLMTVSSPEPENIFFGGGAGGQRTATPGPISRNRSTRQRLQNFSTAMESIHAPNTDPVELDDDDDVPPGGIPARNEKGERLLIYCGIIDILQNYRLKKKLEHGFKSMVADGNTVSVTRPKYYAQRFLNFFEKQVFKKVPSPMRSPSKKKTQVHRQRSVDGETLDASLSQASAGLNLHTNKPDLIPDTQTQQRRRQNSQNNHQTHQPWSGSTTVNLSHSSTAATTSTTLQSETSTTTLLDDTHLLPKNEEFLPPYSESAIDDHIKINSPGNIQSSNNDSETQTSSHTNVEKVIERLEISEDTENPQPSPSVSTEQYQTAMTTQPSNNDNSFEEKSASSDEQDFTPLSDTDVSIEVLDTVETYTYTAEILVTDDPPISNSTETTE